MQPALHEWFEVISLAPDDKIVALVMRDYVRELEAEDIMRLPKDCQRAIISGGDIDVQDAAVTLLLAELSWRGDEDAGILLREMAQTFALASVRMTQLRETNRPPVVLGD